VISADETVFFWINGLAGKHPMIDGVIRVIACDLFIPVVMFLALIAIWFYGSNRELRGRHQRAVICSLTAMGFSNLVVFILDATLPDRPRPFEAFPDKVHLIFYPPTDPSFPSNAAAASFALAMGIWLYNRRLGYILLVPALLLSFGRVYMGVHYPLDIVGGFLAAILATGIAWLVLKIAEPIVARFLSLARKVYLA
jgi:undecaprenyl-diphosphatase